MVLQLTAPGAWCSNLPFGRLCARTSSSRSVPWRPSLRRGDGPQHSPMSHRKNLCEKWPAGREYIPCGASKYSWRAAEGGVLHTHSAELTAAICSSSLPIDVLCPCHSCLVFLLLALHDTRIFFDVPCAPPRSPPRFFLPPTLRGC